MSVSQNGLLFVFPCFVGVNGFSCLLLCAGYDVGVVGDVVFFCNCLKIATCTERISERTNQNYYYY